MTLQKWVQLTGIRPTHPTTEKEAVSVVYDGHVNDPAYKALWSLSDYKVSSVSGVVIWLVPIKSDVQTPAPELRDILNNF